MMSIFSALGVLEELLGAWMKAETLSYLTAFLKSVKKHDLIQNCHEEKFHKLGYFRSNQHMRKMSSLSAINAPMAVDMLEGLFY